MLNGTPPFAVQIGQLLLFSRPRLNSDGLVQPDHPAGLGPGWKGEAGQLGRSSREWEAGDVLVEVPWGDNELPAFACGVT